jgi:hypothetical protein
MALWRDVMRDALISPLARIDISNFLSAHDPGAPLSTNQGSEGMPFQRWFHFKEAFSPAFVKELIESAPIRPRGCLDPFGGSGTTATTCQFLGIRPTTIEVNPFLADLIEAKLSAYDVDRLIRDRAALASAVNAMEPDLSRYYSEAPSTLCEPGRDNRWVFDREILYRVAQFRAAIEALPEPTSARLFRVLLGALLVPLSNVVISGKGRRYRRNWQRTMRSAWMVDAEFERLFQLALFDICRFPFRARAGYRLIRGDSREVLRHFGEAVDVGSLARPTR